MNSKENLNIPPEGCKPPPPPAPPKILIQPILITEKELENLICYEWIGTGSRTHQEYDWKETANRISEFLDIKYNETKIKTS